MKDYDILFKRAVFQTNDTELLERSGQEVVVLWSLSKAECDVEDVGPMYKVQFQDGFRTDAFEDELIAAE